MARPDELTAFEGPFDGSENFVLQRPATSPVMERVTAAILFAAIRKLPVYEIGGTDPPPPPDAAVAGKGALIWVDNGDQNSPCVAVSDGTDWKVLELGATISDTPP